MGCGPADLRRRHRHRRATFATEVPERETLDAQWLPDHRWIAEIDGAGVGWASLSRVSGRDCYAGVVENSVYLGDGMRGRGVGKSLLRTQVMAADDAGLWTLQSAIFPGTAPASPCTTRRDFGPVGVRERIAQRDGVWRDTVLLERRSASS